MNRIDSTPEAREAAKKLRWSGTFASPVIVSDWSFYLRRSWWRGWWWGFTWGSLPGTVWLLVEWAR
jgi:hypothetical protein